MIILIMVTTTIIESLLILIHETIFAFVVDIAKIDDIDIDDTDDNTDLTVDTELKQRHKRTQVYLEVHDFFGIFIPNDNYLRFPDFLHLHSHVGGSFGTSFVKLAQSSSVQTLESNVQVFRALIQLVHFELC